MRDARSGTRGPLEASCFPLVPYANRIAGGRFDWQGRKVQLERNFTPETSSIHGLGWEAAWQVTSSRDFKLAMEHSHDGQTGWPWSYHAQQRVRLGEKGCAITLNCTNLSDTPMPAGLGLHPYFRRRPETKVRFGSKGICMVDDALIPEGNIAPPDQFGDFSKGSNLPAQTIDHCYCGWDGTARIEDNLGTITLTAIGAPFLQLYAPSDGSALCLEPVSHMPDALNQDRAGMTHLPPLCTATIQLKISAT